MLRHLFGRSVAATNHDAVGIEALAVPIVVTDMSGAISAINPAFERLIERHRDVLSRYFQHVEPAELVRATLEKLPSPPSTSGEPACDVVSFDTLHLEVTRSLAPGERNRYVLEWRDVSERVARETDDARRRSVLAAIDRSQPRVVLNLNRNVCEVNAELERLLGYSQSELAGKPHRELLAESSDTSAEVDDAWTRVCRGEVVHGEFERRARDGTSVWLLGVYAPVYDAQNKLCCVNAIATDITHQKNLRSDVERFLDETRHVMARVSEGDLTALVEGPFDGDLGDLMQVINKALQALNQTLGRLTTVADHVGAGVEEISGGNSDLRRRTEKQAGSLERSAGRLRSITDTVRQNANSAAEANALAKDAQLRAETGGEVAEKAVEAMAQIDASSQRIADITSVIDSIAFRTNLLALNASVEAARAGEEGRGFAVVADEVRELAGRSATAAKEIKELIEDASKKVEEGSRLVNDSGQNLLTIVERVQKVTRIVGEIAAASVEQSTGVSEVSESIGQMDHLTQKNAALVEEVAAAGFQLKDEASEMAQIVSRFTVTTAPKPAVALQRRAG